MFVFWITDRQSKWVRQGHYNMLRTSDSYFSNMTDILRLSLVHAFLFVLLVLNMMALPLPFMGDLNPAWALIAIFYWSVYRPTLVPPALCFGAGIAIDLLSGGIIGLNAFIFVVVQLLVRSQRRFLMGQPYVMTWLVFGLMVLSIGLIQWGMQSIAQARILDVLPVMISALASFFIFPYISLLLNGLHRLLPVARMPYS